MLLLRGVVELPLQDDGTVVGVLRRFDRLHLEEVASGLILWQINTLDFQVRTGGVLVFDDNFRENCCSNFGILLRQYIIRCLQLR